MTFAEWIRRKLADDVDLTKEGQTVTLFNKHKGNQKDKGSKSDSEHKPRDAEAQALLEALVEWSLPGAQAAAAEVASLRERNHTLDDIQKLVADIPASVFQACGLPGFLEDIISMTEEPSKERMQDILTNISTVSGKAQEAFETQNPGGSTSGSGT